jgi:CpeT/CpcT family (DUF1001)
LHSEATSELRTRFLLFTSSMFPPDLITLGQYLAGEFDNQQQAIAEPIWYVHLRLWLRPTTLFAEDSLTLFAEQASMVNLDHPYRPRLLRLCFDQSNRASLQVRHYMFKDMMSVRGAGRNPELLKKLTSEQVEFLPNCTLHLTKEGDRFKANPATEENCCFTYEGQTYQVSLGFEATANELKTYDKGIEPGSGKAIWGALMGPYCYQKCQDFANEWS